MDVLKLIRIEKYNNTYLHESTYLSRRLWY